MSAIAQSPTVNRPTTITAATAGLVLLSLLAIPAMFMIARGFDPIVFGIGGTFITLRLIAAYGLWQCRRWGAILGFVATLLDVLLTLPGFADGTVQDGKPIMVLSVVIGIATLVLIVLPSSRHAYS